MKLFAACLAVSILAWPLTVMAAPQAPGAPSTDPSLSEEANAAYLAAGAKRPGIILRPDGLQIKMIQNGFGKRPAVTDTVEVYYTGSLINGHVFDGTSPGLPASFKVNEVVPGWSEALQLMREGDHWQLVLPAALAYGARGAGKAIPPDQVLVFDMTLVSTTPAPKRGEPGYIPDPNDPLDKDK